MCFTFLVNVGTLEFSTEKNLFSDIKYDKNIYHSNLFVLQFHKFKRIMKFLLLSIIRVNSINSIETLDL